MKQNNPFIIFTDLDGTLLDHDTYSWDGALPALQSAREQNIPVIPCTSKTFAECLDTQTDIGLDGPFVFENGAGIALPQDQFRKPFKQNGEAEQGFWLFSLGIPYDKIRQALQHIQETRGYKFQAFGDMSVDDIASATGLPADRAEKAKARRFSEPLTWQDDAKAFDAFADEVQELGLTLTRGGRFIHIAGPTNKGKAMQWLARRYEYKLGSAPTIIALGDSKNDIPMLQAADIGIIIRPRHANPLELTADSANKKIITTKQIGPEGWNEAVLSLIENTEVTHG